jgi:hypothetical protein
MTEPPLRLHVAPLPVASLPTAPPSSAHHSQRHWRSSQRCCWRFGTSKLTLCGWETFRTVLLPSTTKVQNQPFDPWTRAHYSPKDTVPHSASYSTFNQLNTNYCPACNGPVPVATSFQSLLFSLSIAPVRHAATTRCSTGATASFKIWLAQIVVQSKLTSMTHRTTAFWLADCHHTMQANGNGA